MKNTAWQKYKAYLPLDRPQRNWPDQTLSQAPAWCSVDLRDGNQALIEPMGTERKLRLWDELLKIGFKEIEVGFPSASQTEREFLRKLIEENRIPQDVTIQVLTQAREDLIRETFSSLRGVRRAIVHVYNSTSTLQRRVVFGKSQAGIRDIAVAGVEQIARLRDAMPETEIVLEYSPESFTGTEMPFALEVCEAVTRVWQPGVEDPILLNLPATVEMSTPNIYADQIEWFGEQLSRREATVLSVHPHNDRGTAVASAELALLAGADRVEGTLFGNGERTGNVDIVTLALNLLTQGVDPQLDFSDIQQVVDIAESCNRLPVHPRHPYAGELVFTAFSGSHQDAIHKGLRERRRQSRAQQHPQGVPWEVPYLPIDPSDLGRSYEAVIRINSQSGKGGVAHLLERDWGIKPPRPFQIDLRKVVQAVTDSSGEELSSKALYDLFVAEYLNVRGGLRLLSHDLDTDATHPNRRRIRARVEVGGEEKDIQGVGNGPLDAFVDALHSHCGLEVDIGDYCEHSLGQGANAEAMAYVELTQKGSSPVYGAGQDPSILRAGLEAIVSALNAMAEKG